MPDYKILTSDLEVALSRDAADGEDAVAAMESDNTPYAEEVRKDRRRLLWMVQESNGIYLFIVARTLRHGRDYAGHALINYSEWIANRATIMDFYVRPKYRGAKTVRHFWLAVRKFLEAMKVHRVIVNCRSDYEGMIRLYDRVGFRKDADLKNWTSDGADYVQYYLVLEA